MLVLSSRAAVLTAIDAAHRRVDLGAYVLGAGRLRDALAAAAQRGTAVTVTLQRDPYGDPSGALRRENAATARVLRAAGVTVHAFERERRPFHLKAAVIDSTSYLDDRNWPTGGGIVVRDTRRLDADVITRALRGAAPPPRNRALATTKDAALAAALELVRAAAPTATVVWSTESFGAGPVAAALRARAQAGEPTRLILDARRLNRTERSLVDGLARAGVEVTHSSADEKFVLAGAAVWVGQPMRRTAARSAAIRRTGVRSAAIPRSSRGCGSSRTASSGSARRREAGRRRAASRADSFRTACAGPA